MAAQLRPQGDALMGCDYNARERWVNVLTSVPYAAVGVHMWRNLHSRRGKVYAGSQVAVSAAALVYHASSGPARKWCRRVDYWAIAIGAMLGNRAVFPGTPVAVSVLSALATPFQPFTVSTVNTLALELEFLRRTVNDPDALQRTHLIHCGTAAVGLAIFALDEIRPGIPLCHATWHGLSAAAVACTLTLVQHVDAEQRAAASSGLSRAGSLRRATSV